jgi:hypothetical protein
MNTRDLIEINGFIIRLAGINARRLTHATQLHDMRQKNREELRGAAQLLPSAFPQKKRLDQLTRQALTIAGVIEVPVFSSSRPLLTPNRVSERLPVIAEL